jgi:hypothetical protein
MINFWTIMGTAICFSLALLWLPVLPKRKRIPRDERGLKLTPEVEKAREIDRNRVKEIKDGRG